MNLNSQSDLSENARTILREADLCVKCGLCLPQCPTYLIYKNEADSPRGRIALAQGLVEGVINVETAELNRLDHCLLCRTCEMVCPSNVKYSRLFEATIAEYPAISSKKGLIKVSQWFAMNILSRKSAFSSALKFLYRRLPVKTLLKGLPGKKAARLSKYSPSLSQQKLATTYAAFSKEKAHVAFFVGCVSGTDKKTIEDTINVLRQVGVRVTIPEAQVCCGALSQRNGDIKQSIEYIRKNINAFADKYDALVFTASGCGSMLKDYADNHALDEQYRNSAQQFSASVMDVCEYLNKSGLLRHRQWHSLPEMAALHLPCSLRNSLKQENSTSRILKFIPDLKVENVTVTSCCGAGGTHMLSYPVLADGLATDICQSVNAIDADVLLTSNIGCAMHLDVNLKRSNMKQAVLHPISLINMSLKHE